MVLAGRPTGFNVDFVAQREPPALGDPDLAIGRLVANVGPLGVHAHRRRFVAWAESIDSWKREGTRQKTVKESKLLSCGESIVVDLGARIGDRRISLERAGFWVGCRQLAP
jgi:hypothetical protein